MPQADVGPDSQSVPCPGRPDSAVENALLENRAHFLRFLSRKLGSPEAAAEVFQDFCERALRKGRSLRESRSVVPWLYRVLSSCIADHQKGEANRRRFEAEYAAQQQTLAGDVQSEVRGTSYACVYALLPRLRPDYAEILLKLDLDGESRSTVAERLGITGNNIAVRLHRARQAMKRALLRFCDDCLTDGFLSCTCGSGSPRHTGSTPTDQDAVTKPM